MLCRRCCVVVTCYSDEHKKSELKVSVSCFIPEKPARSCFQNLRVGTALRKLSVILADIWKVN